MLPSCYVVAVQMAMVWRGEDNREKVNANSGGQKKNRMKATGNTGKTE